METIKFLGLLSLTWLMAEGADPVQFFKKLANIHAINDPKPLILKVIRGLVNCSLCLGFWVGLSYYWWNGHPSFILMACLVSVAAEVFARTINLLFNHILNKL